MKSDYEGSSDREESVPLKQISNKTRGNFLKQRIEAKKQKTMNDRFLRGTKFCGEIEKSLPIFSNFPHKKSKKKFEKNEKVKDFLNIF